MSRIAGSLSLRKPLQHQRNWLTASSFNWRKRRKREPQQKAKSMNLSNRFPKILIALPAMLFMASCQTSNGFTQKEVQTAVAEQVSTAQRVDLPAVPENCTDKYRTVKVVLPPNSRLESDARRLRAGLNLANARIRTSNAQIERCLGGDGWYETVREGFNQPHKIDQE